MWKSILLIVIIIGIVAFIYMKKDNVEIKNSEMLQGEGVVVATEDINYFENAKGFYAHPVTPGVYPGVVMIHEWWGLNDNVRDMARELAKEGYNVMAVDLFGKLATTSDEAMAQVRALNQAKALENLKAAINYLKENGSTKLASLGWCFGGGQSLQLALSGERLDATVIYYGQLVTTTQALKPISWPMLGIFGDKDQSISVNSVRQFESALNSLGVKNEIHIYPGVGHAFANPSGTNYAPNETKDAWEKTIMFLRANLR